MPVPTSHAPPSIYDIKRDAILTNGKELFEVVAVGSQKVQVRDCSTEETRITDLQDLLEEPWWLVRPAENRPNVEE